MKRHGLELIKRIQTLMDGAIVHALLFIRCRVPKRVRIRTRRISSLILVARVDRAI